MLNKCTSPISMPRMDLSVHKTCREDSGREKKEDVGRDQSPPGIKTPTPPPSYDHFRLGLTRPISVTASNNFDPSTNRTVLVRNESSILSPQVSLICHGSESGKPGMESDSEESTVDVPLPREDSIRLSYEENDLSESEPTIHSKKPELPILPTVLDRGMDMHLLSLNEFEEVLVPQFTASRAYLFNDDDEREDQFVQRLVMTKGDPQFERRYRQRPKDIWMVPHNAIVSVYVEALANTGTILLVADVKVPYMLEFCWMREEPPVVEQHRPRDPEPVTEVRSTVIEDLQEEPPRPGLLRRFLNKFFGC